MHPHGLRRRVGLARAGPALPDVGVGSGGRGLDGLGSRGGGVGSGGPVRVRVRGCILRGARAGSVGGRRSGPTAAVPLHRGRRRFRGPRAGVHFGLGAQSGGGSRGRCGHDRPVAGVEGRGRGRRCGVRGAGRARVDVDGGLVAHRAHSGRGDVPDRGDRAGGEARSKQYEIAAVRAFAPGVLVASLCLLHCGLIR